MTWVGSNCELTPVKAALNIKRANRHELEEATGKSFLDSILIASESGYLLYSDDERLRSFAKAEFNVDGVWTQMVLAWCLDSKLLEKNDFCGMVIKLINFNYHYTSISADVLLESAKQTNWKPIAPYTIVLEPLRGNASSDASVLLVAVEFLSKLWEQQIQDEKRYHLAFALLDVVASYRNQELTLRRLEAAIKVWPLVAASLKRVSGSLIKAWKRMHKM